MPEEIAILLACYTYLQKMLKGLIDLHTSLSYEA